jgi:hypothetical protein
MVPVGAEISRMKVGIEVNRETLSQMQTVMLNGGAMSSAEDSDKK